MTEKPTALPPVDEGSDGVIDLNDKAQAYLHLAAQHAQRAAKATDPKLAATFLSLAKQYRGLAIEISVPSRWRPRPPISVESRRD
jgi:hypothetical protein